MYRPSISEDTKETVEELTEDQFSIPAERVTFEDRVVVLADELKQRRARNNLENAFKE